MIIASKKSLLLPIHRDFVTSHNELLCRIHSSE